MNLLFNKDILKVFHYIMLKLEAYEPPTWISSAVDLTALPQHRFILGNLPTPMHQFRIPGRI